MKKSKQAKTKQPNKGTLHIKIKAKDTRNEMHFEVQRKTKAHVFRDKTKYTRKRKHKSNDIQ